MRISLPTLPRRCMLDLGDHSRPRRQMTEVNGAGAASLDAVLLKAALALAEAEGWSEVGLSRIAERAGVPLPEVGQRFRDADAIDNAWFFQRHRPNATSSLAAVLTLVLVVLLALHGTAMAHEQWVMTPEQMQEWDAKPLPDLFTDWSPGNVIPTLAFLAFLACWVRLGFTGARELFPDLQARLASHGHIVAPILRFCLAWALLSSALGAEPRVGVPAFSTPTLFAPDLLLRQLSLSWAWLRWAEIVIGLALLFGIYVRFFAAVLIGLGILGLGLFGAPMLSYVGVAFGACIYLVLQGPGRYFLPLPLPASPLLEPVRAWLASQPRQRAQAILRVLTGATVLYMGISYKMLHPNLMIGIIKIYDLPVLSLAPEYFTLIMMLVEVAAGLLIIAGILLRPLAIVLMAAFLFFASLLPESYMGHALFYGVVLSFFINGARHWRAPNAR